MIIGRNSSLNHESNHQRVSKLSFKNKSITCFWIPVKHCLLLFFCYIFFAHSCHAAWVSILGYLPGKQDRSNVVSKIVIDSMTACCHDMFARHMLDDIVHETGRPNRGNGHLFCEYVGILSRHYNDAIMGAIVSQITSLTIVYSTVYSGADQRKHQSSASLTFARGIHRGPVNSPLKGPVTRKMVPFDDVIMTH